MYCLVNKLMLSGKCEVHAIHNIAMMSETHIALQIDDIVPTR